MGESINNINKICLILVMFHEIPVAFVLFLEFSPFLVTLAMLHAVSNSTSCDPSLLASLGCRMFEIAVHMYMICVDSNFCI